MLEDVAAGRGESRLKQETVAPVRHPIAYSVNGRGYRGDLYVPEDAPMAALVLVPGAAPAGKDDPRFVAFASTLARARFVVLVPDLPDVRALKVRARDAVGIADAFGHLVSGLDPGTASRAGIGAISYACGPAVLAALEPRLRGQVAFILAVGGYYDLERVLAFATTGHFQEAGEWRRMTPASYGKWVFVLSNLDLLSEPGSRDALRRMAESYLFGLTGRDGGVLPELGAEGRAVYALVQNQDPERAPALIQALPERIRTELQDLNLAGRDLSGLQARVILVHGKDDAIIPYTESVSLAAALPAGTARLFVVEGLSHVDIRPEVLDKWTLVRAVRALLAERQSEVRSED